MMAISGSGYRLRRFVATGLLTVAGLLTACAPVQTTQSGSVGVKRTQYMSGLVPESALRETSVKQYSQTLAKARSQGRLDTNRTHVNRIRAITQRLLAQVGAFRPDATQWPWEVHVIQDDSINAWCMPAGKMAVHSGLIDKLQPTDAELAAVLGHEIAHALREHAREQVSQQMATSMGLSVLAAVTGVRATADLGGELTKVMFTLPNSRAHEAEADRIGVELAARAGYDPRAAITLWQKMAAAGGSRPPEFLSTHPSPASRMADLQQAIHKVLPLYQQGHH